MHFGGSSLYQSTGQQAPWWWLERLEIHFTCSLPAASSDPFENLSTSFRHHAGLEMLYPSVEAR